MSFSFGFADGDIGADDEPSEELKGDMDVFSAHHAALAPAKSLKLKPLLAALPSQIAFNVVPIQHAANEGQHSSRASSLLHVARRSVHDIRTQMMAEADTEANNNDALLQSLDRGDLSSGHYEGGFKTWECSVDLAQILANLDLASVPLNSRPTDSHKWHIVELGAGSAVPSMVLLQQAMSYTRTNHGHRFHFTLCDYNEDVLRLCTAPNVLLNYLMATNKVSLTPNPGFGNQANDQDIDLEELAQLVGSTTDALVSVNIAVDLISGAWGEALSDLIKPEPAGSSDGWSLLVLASETIYSPNTLSAFCDTVLTLLKQYPGRAKALIAAKRIYFGVGGGVNEFVKAIELKGGLSRFIFETTTAGVNRVILEVTMP